MLSPLTEDLVDLLLVVTVPLHGAPDLLHSKVWQGFFANAFQVASVKRRVADDIVHSRSGTGQRRLSTASLRLPYDHVRERVQVFDRHPSLPSFRPSFGFSC